MNKKESELVIPAVIAHQNIISNLFTMLLYFLLTIVNLSSHDLKKFKHKKKETRLENK